MIEIKNLTKIYDDMRAVDGISLTVRKGATFGFLGANGAGKTTTLKMLVGLAFPDSGNILIDGKSPEKIETREQIGFFPETPSFYEYLTGLEFLEFAVSLSSHEFSKKRAEELLKDMGIYDARNEYIRNYSKGMKARLGFAQAIIHDPEYIFLDEPLDGLDPLGRKHMKNILRKLKAKGATIFFSSHILFDAEELCDEIGVIHKGKLLYTGETQKFCGGISLEERFVEVVEKQSDPSALSGTSP
ncbi:ABC transporter ATP-binding protein [bacterium]|nr:ABC transporter ATP-binding protein [bacterium]